MIVKVLVSSPFQVLCAAELISASKSIFAEMPKYDVIILETTGEKSSSQAREAARILGLSYRLLGSERGNGIGSALGIYRSIRREISLLSENDGLVVGNPSYDLMADALGRAKCRWRVALDDGTVSISYLDAITRNKAPPTIEGRGLAYRKAKSLILGGLSLPDWGSVTWFTIFSSLFGPDSRVVPNSMVVSRSRCCFLRQSDHVIFLGSPLVTSGLLDEGDYFELCRRIVRKIRDLYPGKPVVYLKHRREALEGRAYDNFDLVEESVGPVEMRWFAGEAVPAVVAGVISTALFSLPLLLRGEAEVVAFLPKDANRLFAGNKRVRDLISWIERSGHKGLMGVDYV